MNIKKFAPLFLAGVMALAMGTAFGAEEAESTFTYAIGDDPGINVNPINSTDRWGLMTSNMIYSPLFKTGGEEPEWYLATGYELSEDQKTYTFTLRDDVQWSDGEQFTAKDVAYTIELIEDEANASEMYTNFVNKAEGTKVEVEVIDDYTISFTFPSASAANLESLAYQIYILPEHIFKDVDNFDSYEFSGTSVGTGPYILKEYQVGSYLKFEKNENYFMNTPNIDNVVYRVITDQNTAMMALQSGEVDAWAAQPITLSSMDLEGNNLELHAHNQSAVGYLAINCKTVPDVNVRKAILYAIDKPTLQLMGYLNEENYDDVNTFLPPSSVYYNDTDVEKYEQDLTKAQELLTEAGAAGLSLKLAYNSNDTAVREPWAQLIQAQLAAVGITVELVPMESSAYNAEQKNPDKDFDLFFGSYIKGNDPSTYADHFISGNFNNYANIESAKADELFAKGATTFDVEERKEIFAELQKEIADTAAFYPLVSNNYLLVTNKRIGGFDEAKLVPIYVIGDVSYLTINE